jgi:hypothetical protein
MPAAIVIGLLAAIFIGYGCVALARKVRLRSTATALEGEYIDEGWFRPDARICNIPLFATGELRRRPTVRRR